MKIITDETFIVAKINQITKTVFRHVVSDLPRIKMHIDCNMDRCDYDYLKSLEGKYYIVSFTEDLIPLGLTEFIPPFEASTIYLNGQYDGTKYKTNLYLAQI